MSETTHITIVLDKSGSMSGKEAGVISALNEFVGKQQKVKGKAKLSIYMFNDEVDIVVKNKKLKEEYVPLTKEDYICSGMTALNDAIGVAMRDILKKDGKRILVVQTDGYENCSREYNRETIEKYIKDNEKDVEVVFIGAGIDTQQADSRGVMRSKSMSVPNTHAGHATAYSTLSATVALYRSGTVAEVDVSGDTSET